MAKLQPKSPEAPPDVAAIRRELRAFYNLADQDGRIPCNTQWGIYAFYDFDGEPIYVGQTCEKLRSRIGRHLTNQRTDAVAMFVLDPFEVESVEVWAFFELEGTKCSDKEAQQLVDAAERTVFEKALRQSRFHAVLNEKMPPKSKPIQLPESWKASIIPEELRESRSHPDIRIARRAHTISNLARVISERGEVNPGLRHTLIIQARRLEWLAESRVNELGAPYPAKGPGEETGEDSL
ncbi:MAG: GIY-YIG nuclease family protein [Actinomycetota bacterium]|nr:GIY-YIG nuclease family protein [Actinomycetota bacterium]